MQKFVETQGKITLNPKLGVKKETQPQFIEQLNAKEESTLTPLERSRQRKALRNQIEFERLKRAAADARLGNSIGQSLKQQELHGTGSALGTVRSLRPNNQPADLGQTNGSEFDEVNNRTMDYASSS